MSVRAKKVARPRNRRRRVQTLTNEEDTRCRGQEKGRIQGFALTPERPTSEGTAAKQNRKKKKGKYTGEGT